MLIAVALNERSKPHSRVAVADLIFRIIGTHLLEANQQEELKSIRRSCLNSWKTVDETLTFQ